MPVNIDITPATANPGVTSGVRGNLPGVAVSVLLLAVACRTGNDGIPLKTEVLMADVGAAPLIFDVTAVIEMADVDVAEVELEEEFEDVAITDEDPDPEWDCVVVESPTFFPELLPPDCVGLLDCVFEASVIVDGVVGSSLLCT
jgi:hypothetical protein